MRWGETVHQRCEFLGAVVAGIAAEIDQDQAKEAVREPPGETGGNVGSQAVSDQEEPLEMEMVGNGRHITRQAPD